MQDRDRKSAKGKAPISRHPLFPAVVALWFGALFGLGSMAIRPGLIEDMVLAAGIDTLVPAAAPPLGMTARLLLALTMAGLGGLIGGLLARRLARPAPEPRTRRRGAVSSSASTERFAQPARRAAAADAPAIEELDSTLAPKRRSLAIEAQVTPREMQEHAPLPGGPLILNVSDIDTGDFVDAPRTDPWAAAQREAEPAAPPAFARTPDLAPDLAPDFVPPRSFSAPPRQAGDNPAQQPPRAESEAEFELRSESYARIASMAAPAPSPIAGLEPCSHGGPDPIDDVPTQAPASPAQRFAAPDVQQRLFDAPAQDAAPSPFAIPSGFVEAEDSAPEPQPAPDPRPAPQSERAFVPEPVPAASRPPAFSPPSGSAAERLKSSDLAELSPVELVERLAISLQQRRNAAPTREDADFAPAPQVEAPQPPAPAMARFEPIEPQAPALPAEAAAPAAQRALPAALRPLSFDDEDEDIAEAPSFALPPRHVAATGLAASSASGPSEDAPDETGEDDLDEGYSSLLELSRQSASRGPGAKQTFIRIEEPDHTPGDAFEPVVVFPGQASRLQGAERTPEPLVPDTPAGAPGGEPPAALPEVAPVTAQAVRRFDNPALQSPAGMAGRKDPEEAERALRSALATLQRMSGAA